MTTTDVPPQLALQHLIQVTQGIYLAARLCIADLLKDGPRTSEEQAQVTGTHAPSLYRVLRLLTAVGLLTEQRRPIPFCPRARRLLCSLIFADGGGSHTAPLQTALFRGAV